MPFRQFDLLKFNNFSFYNSSNFVNNSENFFDSLFYNSKLLDGSGRYTKPRGLLTTLNQIFTYREFEKYRKEHHRQRFRGVTPYWIQNSLKNRFNFKGFYSSPEARYEELLKRRYFSTGVYSAFDEEYFDKIAKRGRLSSLNYLADKRILEFVLKDNAKSNAQLKEENFFPKINHAWDLNKDISFFKNQINFVTDFSKSFSEKKSRKAEEITQDRDEYNFVKLGDKESKSEPKNPNIAIDLLLRDLNINSKYSFVKNQVDLSDPGLNDVERTKFKKVEKKNQKKLIEQATAVAGIEASEVLKFFRPRRFSESFEDEKFKSRKKLKELIMEEAEEAIEMDEIKMEEQQDKKERKKEEEKEALNSHNVATRPSTNKFGKRHQIRHKLSPSNYGSVTKKQILMMGGSLPKQSLENSVLKIDSKGSGSYNFEEAKKRLNHLAKFTTEMPMSPLLKFINSPGYKGDFLINKRFPYHFSKMFPGSSDYFLYNIEKTAAIDKGYRRDSLRHGWKKGFVTSQGLHQKGVRKFFSSPSNISNEMENLRLIQPRFYKSRSKKRFMGSLNSSVGSSYGVNHKASYKASNLIKDFEHQKTFKKALKDGGLFLKKKKALVKSLRDGTRTPKWYMPNSVRRFIRPYNKVLMHMPYLYSKWFTQNPRLSFSVNMDLLSVFASNNYDEFHYICVQSLFLLKRKIMYNVVNLKLVPKKYKILYFAQISNFETNSTKVSENFLSSVRFIFLKTLLVYFISLSRFLKELSFFDLLDTLYSYYIFYLDILFTNKFFYFRLLVNPAVSKFRHDSLISSDVLFENFFYYDYAAKRVLSQIATSNSTIGGWNNPLGISGQYIPGLNFYMKQSSFNFNYQYPDFFSGRAFSPESLILNNLFRQNNKIFGNELFFGEFPVSSNYRPSWHFLPYRIFSPISPFVEYELLQNSLFSKPVKQTRWRLPLNSLRRVYDVYPNHLHAFFSIFVPETNVIVGHDATLPIKLKSFHYMLRKDPLHRRKLERYLSQNSNQLFKHLELFPAALRLKQLHVLTNLNKLVNFTPLVNRRRLSIRLRLWSPIRFNFYYFFNWKTFLHKFSANDLVGFRAYKLNPFFDLYQGQVPLTLKQKALQHLVVSQLPHLELDSRRRVPTKIGLKEFSLLIYHFFNYVNQNFKDKGYSVSERKISRYVNRKLYPYMPNFVYSYNLQKRVKDQNPKTKLLKFFALRKKYFAGHSLGYLILNSHENKDKRMLLSSLWGSLIEKKNKKEEDIFKEMDENFSFMLNSLEKNKKDKGELQEGTLLSFMSSPWKGKKKEKASTWFSSLVKLRKEKEREMRKGKNLTWLPFLWTMLTGKNELDLFVLDSWKEKNVPRKIGFDFSTGFFIRRHNAQRKVVRSKFIYKILKIQDSIVPTLEGPARTLTMLDRWFFRSALFPLITERVILIKITGILNGYQ